MRDQISDLSVRAIMALERWERERTEAARAEYETASAALHALADAPCARVAGRGAPRHLRLVWSRPA